MGFLDSFFGGKSSNPGLISAMEKFRANSSDDNLIELWGHFLKAKVLLATTPEGDKSYRKAKNIREAVSVPFNTANSDKGDLLLAVCSDNDAFGAFTKGPATCVAMSGEDAVTLANVKGLLGLIIDPCGQSPVELKVWQYQIFVEKLSDANKLHALATKFSRAGNHADCEGVLKAAVIAAQKEPGPQHPFTAELNVELAKAMRNQGKLNEAEWIYRRALGIYESCGSHDLEVATTSEQIGLLCLENKKTNAAAPFLTRALDIYESVPGARPESIGKILSMLAEIKLAENNTDEAEQYFKRASISLEERKHPDVAVVLNKIGDMYEKLERPKDALAHFIRTVSVAETIKRCRDVDVAYAAFHAGAIYLGEDNLKEGEPLLEKAVEIYRREGMEDQVMQVQALQLAVTEKLSEQKKAEEEAAAKAQSGRPKFGAGGKKPSELPLLDFGAIKSTAPKATYVPGARAQKPEEEKSSLDPEEEALLKMREFLNSVDKDAPQAGAPDKEQIEAIRPAASGQTTEDAPTAATSPVEAAAVEVSALEAMPSDDSSHMGVEELFTSMSSTVKALTPEGIFAQKKDETPVNAPPAPKQEKTQGSPLPEASTQQAAAPEIAPATASEQDGVNNLFGKRVDGEISMVFNKSMLGDLSKSDRFDKPIGERTSDGQEASTQANSNADRFDKPISERTTDYTQAPPAPPPPAAAAKAGQKESSSTAGDDLDRSLSSAFDSMLAEPKKTADAHRFDTPIAERSAAQPGADRFDKPISERSAPQDDKDRFDKPISERPAPLDKSRFDKPINATGLEDSGNGLFGDAIDDSLTNAFDSLMSKPQESAAKPTTPEPVQQTPAPLDKSRFDKPVNGTGLEDSGNGLFGDAIDDSLTNAFNSLMAKSQEKAAEPTTVEPAGQAPAPLDRSRFDKPINSGGLAEADNSLFGDGIEDSLTNAFNSLMAKPEEKQPAVPPAASATSEQQDKERYDKPIAERATTLDRSRFDKPINAAGLDDDGGNSLFAGSLDDSLTNAFNGLLSKPEGKQAEEKPAPPLVVPQAEPAVTASAPAASPPPAVDGNRVEAELATARTPEELIKLLEQKLQDQPDNSDLWLRKGTALVQQQRLDEAIKVFDRVTSMSPNNVKAWYCKGSSLHLKNRFEDALYCFNHVLNLDKDNIKAMLRKAECLVKLGRGDQGMVIYDRILLLQPQFSAGWLSKARALLQQRKLEDALECYKQVLQFEPNNEEAVKAKNLISQRLGAAAAN